MPDVFTKKKRSAVMSRIRGSGNKDTELRLIQIFRTHGVAGWRRGKAVFGKPDFIFPRSTGSGLKRARPVALFVDGCFWHGCPKHGTKPKNNAAFWRKKIAVNKARDRLVSRTLRAKGWRVIRIWEHELTRKNERRCLARILRVLNRPTK